MLPLPLPLRTGWMLRRRSCTAPALLLALAALLLYHTSTLDRARVGTGPRGRGTDSGTDRRGGLMLLDPEQLHSLLEVHRSERSCSGKAIVLTGQHTASDTEVQLYQRVLEEQGYRVDQGRYAETSAGLRHDGRDGWKWSLLICLKGTEKSCLRKINFSHPQAYQKVNLIPAFVGAFLDMGGVCRFLTDKHLSGVALPIIPSACSPLIPGHEGTEEDWNFPVQQTSSVSRGPFAIMNVYVLVTSAMPLTAFLHQTGLVKTHLDKYRYATKLLDFFSEQMGQTLALQTFELMKQVISDVLTAAVLATVESSTPPRCRLCFQLMTFTLQYNSSMHPVVVKLQTDLHFEGMKDPYFDGQVTKEYVLEDMLRLLFPPCNHDDGLPHSTQDANKYSGCELPNGLCMSPDEMQLLLQFHQQLKTPDNFHLLHPRSSHFSNLQHDLIQRLPKAKDSGKGPSLSFLLEQLSSYYIQRNHTERSGHPSSLGHKKTWSSNTSRPERCLNPHLRQLYTDPPLVLTPVFYPWVNEYHADIPFDIITIRIRPEPVSEQCHVHLDEHRGPRMANYPVGLGNSQINILVMDESGAEPVVMTIYTLHIFRESRPSLPMFDEYVMCGLVQDCGLVVRPDQPCGLESIAGLKSSGKPQARPCSSGDEPGRWVVPCLSCSDNRTCDWREVAWQPDSCYHPVLEQHLLHKCMMDKKVLFIGDSTNRGIMYYLMERVNTTLEDWDKAHDTIIYHNLNQGRTLISYSYYPQFWLHKSQRPTFQRAIQQLIERSLPLENSHQTVLVVGGVQWLRLDHLKTIQKVLERMKLQNIMVVVKSLGMGFHLPVDGIRSLSLAGVQELYGVNKDILESAKHLGFEVIDTFSITMGRYKEFMQGRCACHFHEVGRPSLPTVPAHQRLQIVRHTADSMSGTSTQSASVQQQELWSQPILSYHVKGAINRVYSEILLSRVCVPYVHNGPIQPH